MNFKNFKASVNDLRVPTVLEEVTSTYDTEGGQAQVWTPQTSTIFVNETVRRSTYIGEGQQMMVENLHTVVMRYRKGVTSGAKWRFNGPFGIWYIQTVIDPKNDRHWLVTVCTEEAT